MGKENNIVVLMVNEVQYVLVRQMSYKNLKFDQNGGKLANTHTRETCKYTYKMCI